MQFAIIGAGNVGTAIARGVSEAGHDVTVASPVEDELATLVEALPAATTTTSNEEAVRDADAVVLAVPFGAVEDTATALRDDLAGKLVIDVTNPLAEGLTGLATEGEAGAERVARAAPGARVVKAFNTVFAANQSTARVGDTQLDGFVAGNDAEAKQTVMDLLSTIGFRPIDVGDLAAARYLEGMAFINIALNARNEWSWQSGWKLVGPLE